MILSNIDLAVLLRKSGIGPTSLFISDAKYVTPTSDWVFRVLCPSVFSNLSRLGIDKYKAEKFDCDDYALFAVMLARLAHANTSEHVGTAIPIGFFIYFKDGKYQHAANLGVVDDGKVITFEPQSGLHITLSAAEKRSIDMVYI